MQFSGYGEKIHRVASNVQQVHTRIQLGCAKLELFVWIQRFTLLGGTLDTAVSPDVC